MTLANNRSGAMQPPVTLRNHLRFTLLAAVVLALLFSLLRLLLLFYNRDLIGDTPASTFITAFGMGLRFDLRVVAYAVLPLVLVMVSGRLMALRWLFRAWLTLFASAALFLGALELDFYREFHQRLNSPVFQYMGEDPQTVISMLWHGFPVVRYLMGWALATWVIVKVFSWCDRAAAARGAVPVNGIGASSSRWYLRLPVMFLCMIVVAAGARGTLR